MSSTPRDPWFSFAHATPARIALGRAGRSLPTREVLSFALAHAMARDAVHAQLDADVISRQLRDLGLETVSVASAAMDRAQYLRRPDLGRRLDDAGRVALEDMCHAPHPDLLFVIGDGLSATAVQAHAAALLEAVLPMIADLRIGPAVIVRGARVAIGDEIGAIFGAALAVVLIGERPGLSSPDSLGVYITHRPRPGCNDGERNCISNIRPEGLAPARAAGRLCWLVREALARGLTGVALKDESEGMIEGEIRSVISDQSMHD